MGSKDEEIEMRKEYGWRKGRKCDKNETKDKEKRKWKKKRKRRWRKGIGNWEK
jgi:hypothetical protein